MNYSGIETMNLSLATAATRSPFQAAAVLPMSAPVPAPTTINLLAAGGTTTSMLVPDRIHSTSAALSFNNGTGVMDKVQGTVNYTGRRTVR